jgi:hypothetical protein
LITRDPSQPPDTTYFLLTRRGRKVTTSQQLVQYRQSALLPEGLVHEAIMNKSRFSFIHGDYDVAVLAAMKAVEVAVRTACKYADTELGTDLMRKAFSPRHRPIDRQDSRHFRTPSDVSSFCRCNRRRKKSL